jgi:hypothetical protein
LSDAMRFVLHAVLIGAGATAVMDLWAVALGRLLGVQSLDYAMVGRWLVHLTGGRFRHAAIAAAPAVAGERAIGWIAHYAIGVLLAALLLAGWGVGWAQQPTIGPALFVGIASVLAPFLIMQPGMGSGIAASRTPRPNVARLRSIMTHTVFGLGLYLAGLCVSALRL